MATHFDPYPDDDEAVQAPCGTWLGEASNSTSNWADVDCRLCRKLKVKISADHEASEAAIVEQMGDMAAYMRLGIPTAELEAVDDPVSSSASKKTTMASSNVRCSPIKPSGDRLAESAAATPSDGPRL